MQGQSRRRFPKPLFITLGSVLAVALASTAIVLSVTAAQEPEPAPGLDPDGPVLSACTVAEATQRSVDTSAWSSDEATPYSDVPRFNEEPDPYQTIWMSRLGSAQLGSRTSGDTEGARAFLEGLASAPSADSLGEEASMLYWVAAALPPSESTRSVVRSGAEALREGDGYASIRGGATSVISTARVALALTWQGEVVPAEVLDTLAAELRIADGDRESIQSAADREIQAILIQVLALNERPLDQASVQAALTEWISGITASDLTLDGLAPLHALVAASVSTNSAVQPATLTVSPQIQVFDNGWFGLDGATAPDPQVTFYLQALGLGTGQLDLDWGSVDTGWRQLQGPSLQASGIWAKIATECGFDFPVSDAVVGAFIDRELSNEALSAQTAVQLGHLAEATSPAFDEASAIARLDEMYSAAVGENDWVGSARIYTAARALGVGLAGDTGLPDQPPGDTSLEIYASRILSTTSTDTESQQATATTDSLERDGLFVYSPEADTPDIISTSFLAAPGDGTAKVEAFSDGVRYCESPPDGDDACSATLLALGAAVTVSTDEKSMWW